MTHRSSLRPTAGEDRAAWTRSVFAAGDYAGAAMFGCPSTWQHHAGLAMVRGDAAAFATLAGCGEPEARLHLAAARFIHGDDATAMRELAAIDLPHAQNLLRLLQKPRLQVLSQLSWLRGTVNDLVSGAAADPRFEVRNVSYHPLDVQNQPYADVRRFVDDAFRPDFFVSGMVEWHPLPPNLQELDCPLFGHIADYDLHVQSEHPWLSLFDELFVTDRTEWLGVQGLAACPVASFPKVFGLPPQPALGDEPRELDFFVSGTMLDPFYPDKAALMHEVLAMPDLNVRVVRGFLDGAAYRALLAATKASFTYVRRPGAMPTRGLESLAMGCAVALQEESVLNLWVGRDEGVATYGPAPGDLKRCLAGMLGDFAHYGPAARRGAEVVRREFDLQRVASQYLRFCAFRAAAPRGPRRRVDSSRFSQARGSVSRSCMPDSLAVRRRMVQANFKKLGEVLAAVPSAVPLTKMARELLSEHAFYARQGKVGHAEQQLLDDAVQLLEKGIRLWPDRLVLRFDLVRALVQLGSPAARLRGWQLAWDTLQADIAWQVDPREDVLPFDFDGACFDFRSYLTAVTDACRGRVVPTARFVSPLLASLAGYLARKTGRIDLHERAAALDPGFARYRMDLAEALLRQGGPAARGRAIGICEELAHGSTEFARAADRLVQLRQEGERVVVDPLPARRIAEHTFDVAVMVRDLFTMDRRDLPPVLRRSGIARETELRLAVLMPDAGSVREMAAVVGDLQLQTIAEEIEVVVAVDATSPAMAAMLATFAGGKVRVRTAGCAAVAYGERLDACIAAATAPIVTVAMPGDRFRADACEVLALELEQNPGATLVAANEGLAAVELGDFRREALIAVRCLPAFTPERQRTIDCTGLHAAWRRSLHVAHGPFGAAGERAFWLRVLRSGATRTRREVLTIGVAGSVHRARRGAADSGWIDTQLLGCAIGDEARLWASLGTISAETANRIAGLETFCGTALVQGDFDTALRMLRTCVALHPYVLAARLSLARLCDAIGAPGGEAVLREGLQLTPQAELLRRHLARYAPRTATLPRPVASAVPC